jgi:phosphoglycolate phosphatase-like HAD superfamily hydrolase
MTDHAVPPTSDAPRWDSPVEVAVIDFDGTIVAVNSAWRRIAELQIAAADRNALLEGGNYLAAVRLFSDDEARDAIPGVTRVLAREVDEFCHEYERHLDVADARCELRATPLPEGALIARTTSIAPQLAA